MDRICSESECCGCELCVNICPVNAIKMVENEYGVLYPHIDEEICINCGMCKKRCVQLNEQNYNIPARDCYAAIVKDTKERMDSASGGIGYLLYKTFLNKKENAIVFGVEYDDYNIANYTYKDSTNGLSNYKGSKYVQARINDLYKKIEKCLLEDKFVMVIGTPCNIDAAISFLDMRKVSREKLLTIDLICHGVSPEKYLTEHLDFIKKKYNYNRVEKITFRSNRKYRNFHLCMKVYTNNRKKEYNRLSYEDTYFRAFLKGISLRENCYSCKYAKNRRVADITIGDFIGVGKNEKYGELKMDSTNCSIIICNSEKGESFFQEIKDSMLYEKRTMEEALEGCVSLREPFAKSDLRESFLKMYTEKGFDESINTLCSKEIRSIQKKEGLTRSLKILVGKLVDKRNEK